MPNEDAPVKYRDAWVGLRATTIGVTSGGASDEQKYNASKFYNLLRIFGYSRSSACGILGNMQTESGLSPGALQNLGAHISQLPNNAEHLSDLPNSVMINWYDPNDPTHSTGYGTGLIQWDGYSTVNPVGNYITSFAERYNAIWYDWQMQIFRLEAEYIYDPSGDGGINGVTHQYWFYLDANNQPTYDISWSAFKAYTGSPENSADYFRIHRERSSDSPSGIQNRRDNARYWYNYFAGTSVTYQVPGFINASMAYLYRDSGYLYTDIVDGLQMDCIGFCNMVRKQIGIPTITNGTNSLWRNVGGNFLWWRGTLQECYNLYNNTIPVGAYLFKCYPEDSPGYNPPPQYWGDGVGDFNHIGIYTGMGKGVMQSGGYDITPEYGGINGIHDSYFEPQQPVMTRPWWTHVAIGNNIYLEQRILDNPLPVWMLATNKKRRLYNVLKSF